MKFVDIPTAVEACFDEEGRVTPTTFRWRGRDVRISDVGRRWTEPHGPHPALRPALGTLSQGQSGRTCQLRHYLVMTPGQDTFELCLDTGALQWTITRVWERERVV